MVTSAVVAHSCAATAVCWFDTVTDANTPGPNIPGPNAPDPHTTVSPDAYALPLRDDRVLDEVLADGSAVLYHTATRSLMTLNPTAALVWDLCDGEHDELAVIAEVQDVFPNVAHVDADVRTILTDLRVNGMLRPLPAES